MSSESFFRKPAYKRTLITVLVGMMLTATSTIVSVKASPGITVTVSPSSGLVGSTMTVYGVNASSSGEVRIFLGGVIFLATTTADATGGYSVDVTVPAIPAGIYELVVFDVETGDTASDAFTVQPKIVLEPAAGSHMDNITVKGYGFGESSPITLTFDGDDVTPTPKPKTDMLGSFEANFRVPLTPNGTYTVTADDETNNASALLTVVPKITLGPDTRGPPGTFVMVTGTGFAPSVSVTIYFDTINVTIYGGIVTSVLGSFGMLWFPATFFVPDVPDGTYMVEATDETGNSASAPFAVPSPVMTLEPTTTFGLATVTARGSGFPPNQPVLLYLEDRPLLDLIDLMSGSQRLFADEHGSYEYSFIVPVTKPGIYRVTAYSMREDGEELASAYLTIVENPTLEGIEGELATVTSNLTTIIDDLTNINATIEADLSDINARLVGIDGSIATIETDLGTIEADLSDINARLVSIDDNVATIETDVGTIEADVGGIQAEVVPTGYEFGLLATTLALIAAIGAWLSAILIRRKPVQLFATERPKKKSK